MSTVIRFHLDENMPNPVAYGLRARGRDATISNDVGLIGASDEEQLFFALQNQRVLLTRDDDLVKMAACMLELSIGHRSGTMAYLSESLMLCALKVQQRKWLA